MDLEHICMGCMAEKGSVERCPHCGWVEGTQPESPLHLPPRTILNEKYLLGRVLGQGGFGITYLGWDLNLNLKLAIKEYLPQELASRAVGHSQVAAYTGTAGGEFEYGLDKFLQEARTLAQFDDHPNIVSVRDFFRANGTAYLVMSYLDGMDLKEYVAAQGDRLPYDRAMSLIMPVLDALNEVHAVNILHRDVSPDNIFIKQNGQVILIDFGAARQAVSAKGHSLSIILKPGFAPEEQYRSKGVQGPWTDLYAVAATLYRITTGQMPPESLERLSQDTLLPPSRLGVAIGANEERALLKAMAVRAEDRFRSIREFQDALLGKSTVSQAVTAPPSGATWHISRDGARFGPYTWERMVQMAGAGNIGPRDMVWNEGMSSWQSAVQVQGLMPAAAYPYSRSGQQPVSISQQPAPVSWQPGPAAQQPPGPVYPQPAPVSQQHAPVYRQPAPVSQQPASGYRPPAYTPAAPRKKSPALLIVGIVVALLIVIVPGMFIYKNLKGKSPGLDPGSGWWYNVESFQFYESWMVDDFTDDWQEAAAYEFPSSDSYYIYFVLTLSHPEVAEDLFVPAAFYYYQPDGAELGAHEFSFTFEAGEAGSDVRGYFGWDSPGEWPLGLYSVEVWLDDDLAAVGYFEIY